jgi:drug/metabolite transporter (DMT)-like permease
MRRWFQWSGRVLAIVGAALICVPGRELVGIGAVLLAIYLEQVEPL